jgi:hypothetical protein
VTLNTETELEKQKKLEKKKVTMRDLQNKANEVLSSKAKNQLK